MPINFGASVRRLLRNAGTGGTGSDKLDALPTDESYLNSFKSGSAEPFFQDFTPDTLIRDAIDDINEVLGLLIPAQPPLFPGGQSLNLSTQNTRNLAQGAPSNGNSATAGNLYDTVYTNTVSQLGVISGSGPGDMGRLTLEVNSISVQTFNLTGDENNNIVPSANANNKFEIFDNKAYPSEDQPFWQEFGIENIRADIVQGLNNIKMKHDPTDSPETNASADVVYDDLSVPQPTVVIDSVLTSGTTVTYSGIPQARSGTSVEITFTGTDTVGITYVQDVCVASGDRLNQTTYQYSGTSPTSLTSNVPVTSSHLDTHTVTQTVQNDPGMVVPKIRLYNSRGSRQESATVTIPSMGNIDNSSVKQGHIIADRIPIYETKSSSPRFEASASYDPSEQYPTASSPGNFATLPMTQNLSSGVYKSLAVNYAGQVKFSSGSQEDYSSDLLGGPDYSQKSSTQYFPVSFTEVKQANVAIDFRGKITDLYVGVHHSDDNKFYWVNSEPYDPSYQARQTGFVATTTQQEFPKVNFHNGGKYLQFSFANAQDHGGMSFGTGNQTITFVFVMNDGDYLEYFKIYETLSE